MNIDDMKLGDLKRIAAMFGGGGGESLANSAAGKYVIVRSRNEGINAGYVERADDTGVILKNARRLWHHRPKAVSESWYEGVANHGIDPSSKISGAVEAKIIIEDYSMTICTEDARQSIESAVANAQNQ